MIQIDAALNGDGLLTSCYIQGHAGAGLKGSDIVCAAVSVLARTTIAVCTNRTGVSVCSTASERGLLQMDFEYTREGMDFLYAVGVFLIEGLKSICQEYPQNCRMNIKEAVCEK